MICCLRNDTLVPQTATHDRISYVVREGTLLVTCSHLANQGVADLIGTIAHEHYLKVAVYYSMAICFLNNKHSGNS